MGIGSRPASCTACGKRLGRKHWYYRNGLYFCQVRCWETHREKLAEEKAAKDSAAQAAAAKPSAPAEAKSEAGAAGTAQAPASAEAKPAAPAQ